MGKRSTKPESIEPAQFEPDYLPDDDDQGDDEPTDVEPEPAPRPRQPLQVEATTPMYLRDLLCLPGVDPDALKGINLGVAWARIESSDGTAKQMPVAHLAPDALDTLADMGFQGHTTFEIRASQNGQVVRYFACRLDELDPEPAPEGPKDTEGMLVEAMTRQQQQIAALEAKLNAPPSDPLSGLESALQLFERFSKIMGRLPVQQIAAPAGNDLGTIVDTVAKVLPMFQQQGGNAPDVDLPDGAPPDGQ